jgi:hypothetical protein
MNNDTEKDYCKLIINVIVVFFKDLYEIIDIQDMLWISID